MWSALGEAGLEVLVERPPAGEARALAATGDGARWPSVSGDGQTILFTTVERQVEY